MRADAAPSYLAAAPVREHAPPPQSGPNRHGPVVLCATARSIPASHRRMPYVMDLGLRQSKPGST